MAMNELHDEGKDFGERKIVLKEAGNHTVRRPIPRSEKDVLKVNKGGRPRKITPTKMVNAINRYFAWCEKHDELPSIKGMMIHMKLYKDSFYRYIKDERFTDLLEHARLIISDWTAQDVYKTSGQAAGKLAYMKNVHDWSEKIDTRTAVTTQKLPDVQEAKALIAEMLPELLELLDSPTTVQQIGKDVQDAEIVEDKK